MKCNISKELLEDLYVIQKLSIGKIAKKLGISQQAVFNRMKEFGIKSRTRSEAAKINIDKKILEDLYIAQELSMKKIAEKLGVGEGTILRRMEEFGIKRRTISETHNGKKNPFYGKHHLEGTKEKISRANKGKHLSEDHKKRLIEINLGKQISEETKRKLSEALKGKFAGEKNPNWKGGRDKKIKWARHQAKRRQLGFKPLNKPFDGFEAHHLQDKETVIYIPKELHRRISHNNWTGKGMNTIDALALDYLELQILREVI
jgi:predicted DNA-binding protein YlxM (UPF0122 family)